MCVNSAFFTLLNFRMGESCKKSISSREKPSMLYSSMRSVFLATRKLSSLSPSSRFM